MKKENKLEKIVHQDIGDSSEPVDLLASRLEHLFANKLRPDGRRYSQDDVVQGCRGEITRVYLWKLRTGRARNPSMRVIQALANFFGVSVDYFSRADVDQLFEDQQTLENPLVRQMAEKLAMLDERGRWVILNLIDYLLQAR